MPTPRWPYTHYNFQPRPRHGCYNRVYKTCLFLCSPKGATFLLSVTIAQQDNCTCIPVALPSKGTHFGLPAPHPHLSLVDTHVSLPPEQGFPGLHSFPCPPLQYPQRARLTEQAWSALCLHDTGSEERTGQWLLVTSQLVLGRHLDCDGQSITEETLHTRTEPPHLHSSRSPQLQPWALPGVRPASPSLRIGAPWTEGMAVHWVTKKGRHQFMLRLFIQQDFVSLLVSGDPSWSQFT